MALDSLRARLILCNVPTTNSKAARRFYAALLGVEAEDFARGQNEEVESYFLPLSEDGIDLTVTERYTDEERLTCYFAVEDLKATLDTLTEHAGVRVAAKPRSVVRSSGEGKGEQETIGTMAVVIDPDGNHVGIMQVDADSALEHFRLGQYGRSLSPEQIQAHTEARRIGASI